MADPRARPADRQPRQSRPRRRHRAPRRACRGVNDPKKQSSTMADRARICSCYVLEGRAMTSNGKYWLYERLRSEFVDEEERKRWNSILSSLRPLTVGDESTKRLAQKHLALDAEAARHLTNPFAPYSGEPTNDRSRSNQDYSSMTGASSSAARKPA